MKTTLEIVCNVLGWQGGTIHEAVRCFIDLPGKDQDKVCNELMRAIDRHELDLPNLKLAGQFFAARIGQRS